MVFFIITCARQFHRSVKKELRDDFTALLGLRTRQHHLMRVVVREAYQLLNLSDDLSVAQPAEHGPIPASRQPTLANNIHKKDHSFAHSVIHSFVQLFIPSFVNRSFTFSLTYYY